MFADDVASCAETAVKLQQQLNVVGEFCKITGMKVNLSKTERNEGPLRQYGDCHFLGNTIEVTSVYKYMGLLFKPGLSWSAAQDKHNITFYL
jgi:hypothetical protein